MGSYRARADDGTLLRWFWSAGADTLRGPEGGVLNLRCNDAQQRARTNQPDLLQPTWGPVPHKAPPPVTG
eukprot:11018261-Alexandrium_andersonii.AAC.1